MPISPLKKNSHVVSASNYFHNIFLFVTCCIIYFLVRHMLYYLIDLISIIAIYLTLRWAWGRKRPQSTLTSGV